ncbi:hypothetical protein N9K85_00190 [Flavobacteriaceae bacterium]|jgi:hypothetical protein|nr:hypothetical protein [Flavobacteriaceae bacterium]MDC0571803.1 hypothetical protein [Flavobacteriaceae bacterium]
MGFNSTTGSEAGKISKRGKSLNIDLRNDLKTLITHILKDLDYNSLNNTQKLKLLDIALKHSLPKQSIEQHITEDIPQDIQITIIDSNGNEKVNRKSLDNFKFKDLAG